MTPLALALALTVAVAGAAPQHNFDGDYLIGSWNCSVQAAHGLGVQRTSYKAINNGAALFASALTTGATGKQAVAESRITESGGSFRWAEIYTGRTWHAAKWWTNGTIHLSDPLSGGRSLTLKQIDHKKFTLDLDTLMGAPVVTTCLRQ